MADNRDEKLLTENQSLQLLLKLLPIVRKSLVCVHMRYLYSKQFKDKATGIVTSTYHVFGAYSHEENRDMQKVTYHEESGLIEYMVHPVQNYIKLPFLDQ